MEGDDVGSLNVYTIVPEYYNTFEPHHFFTLIFNITGDQGVEWKTAQVTFDTPYPLQV